MALLCDFGPPHYCTSICVRSCCTRRASCADLNNQKKKALELSSILWYENWVIHKNLNICDRWWYCTSCHRVICSGLLRICSLPTRWPPWRSALDICGKASIFPPRAQYMYKKHFHDAESWPLCCISPAPAPFTITLFHCKWLKRTHEWNSRIWNQRSHIFKFLYITQLSYKRKIHNLRASAINLKADFSWNFQIQLGTLFGSWGCVLYGAGVSPGIRASPSTCKNINHRFTSTWSVPLSLVRT